MPGVLALAIALTLVLAPGAHGASVLAEAGGPGASATLVFEDLGTESNDVSLSASEGADGRVNYVVSDASAPLSAGPGCTGGGPPGAEAVCSLPRSRAMANCFGSTAIICSDPGQHVQVAMRLGQGDDLLDTTAFDGDGGAGPLYFHFEVEGGPGDDVISTGATSDEVDPGPGADRVLTADSFDNVIASEASADGADTLDLGPGIDSVSYERSIGSVSISANDLADDGAPGEADNVIAAERLTAGAGDDTLVGSDNAEAQFGDVTTETLDGGPGDDVLLGNGGPDELDGDGGGLSAGGDDLLRGGEGDDAIYAWDGADIAFGDAGDDSIDLGRGDDRGSGAAGNDYLVGDPGDDRLRGGSGKDRLAAAYNLSAGLRDEPHGRDRLDCGANRDRALFDGEDVARRCESVKVIR